MCEREDCAVHYRVDAEDVRPEMGYICRISYHGEWAVFTTDNSFLIHLMLLAKPELPHMTLLLKVGEGTVGDLLTKEDTLVDGFVYDGFFSEDIDQARNAHDMTVFGIESGILTDDAKAIKPYDLVMRY